MSTGMPDVQGRDPLPDDGEGHDPELVHPVAPDEDFPEEGLTSDDPDGDEADDPADLTAPEPEGLRWEVAFDDPANPFTSHLLFSEDGEPLLWWNLDPVTVTELITALTTVKRAQIAALTGKPAPTHLPESDDTTDDTDDAPAPERRSARKPRHPEPRSWWARHKILTALLILVGLFFLGGFVLGGTKV